MTSDSYQLHLPGHEDLPQRLDDTILWMELRRFVIEEGQAARFQLDRIWPEGTVPRQAEVAELLTRVRALGAIIRGLLWRMAKHRIAPRTIGALLAKHGVELPQSLLERL